MGKILKRNSGIFYWIILPGILLALAVSAVNLVPRPAVSLYGASCPTCEPQDDEFQVTNVCVLEFCNNTSTVRSFCDISGRDEQANEDCPECFICGNGRCEPSVGEDGSNCSSDCLTDFVDAGNMGRNDFVCEDPNSGFPVGCGDNVINPGGVSQPPPLDGCCPIGCQGVDSNASNFDGDCCGNTCGDGIVDPDSGEQCDPQAIETGCAEGEVCTSACLCEASATPTPTPPQSGVDLEGSGLIPCSLQKEMNVSASQGLVSLLSLGLAVGILAVMRKRFV